MADDIVERLRSAWWGEVGTDRTRVIQDAAAEIERLRASDAQLSSRLETVEADLRCLTLTGDQAASDSSLYRGNSVRYWWEKCQAYRDAFQERDAARASEAQAIDDADALCEWLRYYDYPSCRFTTVVGAAIKPACMRALDRRAKKEASDESKRQ